MPNLFDMAMDVLSRLICMSICPMPTKFKTDQPRYEMNNEYVKFKGVTWPNVNNWYMKEASAFSQLELTSREGKC